MENRTITFLPIKEFKVLRVIKIARNNWNRFSGFIIYLRDFAPDKYDDQKTDELDDKVFNTIKNLFVDSQWWLSENILFEGQLDNRLKTLEGGCRFEFTLDFNPSIPFQDVPNLVGQQLHSYPFKFQARMHLGGEDEKLKTINKFLSCSLPYKEIDEMIKSIYPI